MNKSRVIAFIFILVMMCLTLFSFPISYARLDDDVRSSSQVDGEGLSVQATEDALRALQTKNPFEMTL